MFHLEYIYIFGTAELMSPLGICQTEKIDVNYLTFYLIFFRISQFSSIQETYLLSFN